MCLLFRHKKGNFSFIKDTNTRLSIEHDYTHVLPLLRQLSFHEDRQFREGERNSLDTDRPNVWDTPPGPVWAEVSKNMFAGHYERTYNRNIKWLFIIKEKGWYFFVDYYKTDVKI
jgi:hypothetical protein